MRKILSSEAQVIQLLCKVRGCKVEKNSIIKELPWDPRVDDENLQQQQSCRDSYKRKECKVVTTVKL